MQVSIPNGAHNVSNARLTGSAFRDVCLGGASFDDVNLSEANFHNINLAHARFDDVNLTQVEITNANLAGMTIDGILVTDLLRAYSARSNVSGDFSE